MNLSSISFSSDIPNNTLSQIIKEKNVKHLNVFIDWKNTAIGLFVNDIIEEILNNSSFGNKMDSSIFQNIIYTCSVWKKFCSELGASCSIYICNDYGQSVYHKGILPEYKQNRELSSSNYHDVARKEIFEIRDRNLDIAEKVINGLDGCYLFNLKQIESDFLPYYLLTRKLETNDTDLNVICTNDKDLFQILKLKNTIIYSKKRGVKSIYDEKNIFNYYFELDKPTKSKQTKYLKFLENVNLEYFPVMLSFVGDPTDNFKGLENVGKKRVLEMFSDKKIVDKLIGPFSDIHDRIDKGEKLLIEDSVGLNELDVKWQMAIRENDKLKNSFLLADFESLCRWLDKRDELIKSEALKYIDNRLNKNTIQKIASKRVLWDIIKKLENNKLNEDMIEYLF